jgi:hypothetical protein
MHLGVMNAILLHSDHWHCFGYSWSRLVKYDISVPVLLLTKLVHIPPHVPSMYITYRTTLRQQFLNYNIVYLSLFYLLTRIVTKNYMILMCGVIVTYNKHIYTLALTILKMATWVAKTCPWSLCSKITFIKPKCICWSYE